MPRSLAKAYELNSRHYLIRLQTGKFKRGVWDASLAYCNLPFLCVRMRTVVYLQFVVHCRVAPACYALSVRCARSYLNPEPSGQRRDALKGTRGAKGMRIPLLFSKKGNNIPRLVGEVHLRGCSIQEACLTGSTGLNCLAGFEAYRCM